MKFYLDWLHIILVLMPVAYLIACVLGLCSVLIGVAFKLSGLLVDWVMHRLSGINLRLRQAEMILETERMKQRKQNIV